MKSYTVLICDDNMAIHSSLTSYLTAEGLEVISSYDGESALQEMQRQTVDVVILDIMLPGINGYEVCQKIRSQSNAYIIMLSARSEDMDRIVGLELGADDYLPKPFSPREVVIRIKKALNRMYPKQDTKALSLAELTVLPGSYEAFVHGKKIEMTPKEIEVLSFLLSNPGKALTREHILNAAWGYEYYGNTRVVDALIKRLRQKLDQENVHFTIRSIYGIGYKIEETP